MTLVESVPRVPGHPWQMLTQDEIDAAVAEVFAKLPDYPVWLHRVERVIRILSKYWGYRDGQLKKPDRSGKICGRRMMTLALCVEITGCKLLHISKHINQHHSSIIHARNTYGSYVRAAVERVDPEARALAARLMERNIND